MSSLGYRFLVSLGCHRIPGRCFHIRGKPMPLCARCVGMAAGEIASLFWIVVVGFPPLLASVLLCTPAVVDWSLQELFGITSTNRRRLITGLLGGVGYGALLIRAIVWTGRTAIGLIQ